MPEDQDLSKIRSITQVEQAPQGSSHGTKPVRVQGASGQCSWSYSLALGSPARSTVLDSMTLVGPLQLEIFYDSMTSVNKKISK